jgi:hypothetical protein
MRFRRFHAADQSYLLWLCPGCDDVHQVPVGPPKGWTLSGTDDAPTVSPSVFTNPQGAGGRPKCHAFLRAGAMEFLGDCTHALAGTTAPVGELPDWAT